MQNKPIKDENGNEVWISRSVVVTSIVARLTEEKKIEILIEKRGPKVSATGKWCTPCGYLDYDETLTEAVIREVYEETGYKLQKNDIDFIDINSRPDGKKQNVVIRYVSFIDYDKKQYEGFQLDTNEVTELKWVEIGEYKSHLYLDEFIIDESKLECVDWAFKHKSVVQHLMKKYCERYGIEFKIKK